MIGRAPYGHSAVLRAILADERRGSRQPARELSSNDSAGAASPAGSLGAEREPRMYHGEPDGEGPACSAPPPR
jgi:hypothetical protein